MIIATAGHVDHGKTALVRQLTGVDTDRLAEEKRRGLSIDLGFAYRPHPRSPDRIAGFIDVPGHQRFINTMISGVSGIDLGMLVVAADDGIMPQTREHLAILQLLGIHECLGVITKTDRVDRARVGAVATEAAALLENHGMQVPGLFPVSSVSGDGIDQLRDWLDDRLMGHPAPMTSELFRMNVDRVFTLKGVGLVATGTVLSGAVSVDERIRVMPGGRHARVRSLHAQDRGVATAVKGQRCAVNLAGDIGKAGIARGDWLVAGQSGNATTCFTAAAHWLDTPVSVRHRMQAKLYLGARHVAARIGLVTGRPDLVQVMPATPVSCCLGDRFLLRDYSELFLLGGGRVLDPWAGDDRKPGAGRLQYLDVISRGGFLQALEQLIDAGHSLDFSHWCQAWNLGRAEAQTLVEAAGFSDKLAFAAAGESRHVLSAGKWQTLQAFLLDQVTRWHRQHPEQPGMPLEMLVETLAGPAEKTLFPALLDVLQVSGDGKRHLTVVNGRASLAGFDQALPEKTRRLWRQVESILRQEGLEIPLQSVLEKKTGVRGRDMNYLVASMLKSGRLVRVGQKRVGLPETLRALSGEVIALGEKKPRFTVIDFRDHIGTGRNYAIDVLDFLDTLGFTRREGNERMVIDSSVPDRLFG